MYQRFYIISLVFLICTFGLVSHFSRLNVSVGNSRSMQMSHTHTHKTETKPPSHYTGIKYTLRGFSGTLGHEVVPDSNASC